MFIERAERGTLPLQELFPVFSVGLSSRAGDCVCPFDPCPNAAEEAWLWAATGLWTRFPSLPALISLSPMRSMHERLLCGWFLKLGLLDPADPGRPRREEDLDIFPAGLSRAPVRYSRVSLAPRSLVPLFYLLYLYVLLLLSPPAALLSLLPVSCLTLCCLLLCALMYRWGVLKYHFVRFYHPTAFFLCFLESFCPCSCLLLLLSPSWLSSEVFVMVS